MSAARKLQRKGLGRRDGMQLKAAVDQVRTVVGSLSVMGDVPKVIQELKEQTERISQLADALTDDYQTLLAELEMQREVALQLCWAGSHLPLEYWRNKEAEIRSRLLDETEQT